MKFFLQRTYSFAVDICVLSLIMWSINFFITKVNIFIDMTVAPIYFAYSFKNFRRTVGGYIAGTRVDRDLSWSQSFKRALVYIPIINIVSLFVGVFRKDNRTLHDLISQSSIEIESKRSVVFMVLMIIASACFILWIDYRANLIL